MRGQQEEVMGVMTAGEQELMNVTGKDKSDGLVRRSRYGNNSSDEGDCDERGRGDNSKRGALKGDKGLGYCEE